MLQRPSAKLETKQICRQTNTEINVECWHFKKIFVNKAINKKPMQTSMRILQNKPINLLTDKLCLAYNTLPVPKLRDFQLLRFVHKVVHHPEKLPEVF